MSTYTVIIKNRLTCDRQNIVVEAEGKGHATSQVLAGIESQGYNSSDYMVLKVIKNKT